LENSIRKFDNVSSLKCEPRGPRKVCEIKSNGKVVRTDVGYISLNSGALEKVGVSGGNLEVDFSPSQTLLYDEKIDILMTQSKKV
jgi:hypothetical protein